MDWSHERLESDGDGGLATIQIVLAWLPDDSANSCVPFAWFAGRNSRQNLAHFVAALQPRRGAEEATNQHCHLDLPWTYAERQESDDNDCCAVTI